MNINELETWLRSLLKGEHSSLTISFNDHALSYLGVREAIDIAADGGIAFVGDWVSDEERERAIAKNSVWSLHWYPDTPVGSYEVSASSLEAIVEYVKAQDWR